jgi:hypothetical protein
LLARLKAEGVPYEERIERLEEVTHPQPIRDFVRASFALFAEKHPWVGEEDIRPKSIAREMLEGYEGFNDYVRRYGLQRSEGLLLRHLSQVHNVLARSVPELARSDELEEILGFLRALLARVDSSLAEEWESLLRPAPVAGAPLPQESRGLDLAEHPRAFRARVRAEMRQLVHALAGRDYEEAAACVRQDPEDAWDAARLERELAPFYADHERIVFEPRALGAHQTLIKQTGPRRWDVHQVLVDDRDENLWNVEGEVDLSEEGASEGPLVRIRRIGT